MAKKRMRYMELKRDIDKVLGRTLSFDPYQSHLKRMENENTINKEHTGRRGKPVWYSLTKEVLDQIQIGILGAGNRQEIFRSIYEKILFYDFFKRLQLLAVDRLRATGFSEVNGP